MAYLVPENEYEELKRIALAAKQFFRGRCDSISPSGVKCGLPLGHKFNCTNGLLSQQCPPNSWEYKKCPENSQISESPTGKLELTELDPTTSEKPENDTL